VSPELGKLDEQAFDEALADDPDEALALLADLTGATDAKLRELARRLAGRIVVDLARRGRPRSSGIGRLTRLPFAPDRGDLDLDTSLEPVGLARRARHAPDPADLAVRGWARPATALCLAVDRSGSMGGERLATAAVAAAAVAWRAPADHSVVAFAADVVVAKSQDVPRPPARVVDMLLALRGHGTTDLALGLRTAGSQLSRSRAARKVTILLSDCRATVAGDVEGAAGALDELLIVAPAGDRADADLLASSVGATVVEVAGPGDIPAALARLLPS
jgi:Mg-chelatase subunit ChlD